MNKPTPLTLEQLYILRTLVGGNDPTWVTAKGSDSEKVLRGWVRRGWFEERQSSIPTAALFDITEVGRTDLYREYFAEVIRH